MKKTRNKKGEARKINQLLKKLKDPKDRDLMLQLIELKLSPEQEKELSKKAAASAGKNLERLKNLAKNNPDMASWFPPDFGS